MLKEFDASFDRRIETRAMRSSSMGSTAMPQTGAMATVTKGLFQKSLRDIITGIRANKDRQKDYMNKCLQDIRAEVSVATFVFFAGVEPRRHARARARSFASRRIAVAEPRSSVGHGPCDRTRDAVAAGVAVTTPRASSDDLANSLLLHPRARPVIVR